jgi:hypothetical protein
MKLGGTVEYFRDTVFNYPTMAECYKVAALDGLNKLSLWEVAEMDISADGTAALMANCDLVVEELAALGVEV